MATQFGAKLAGVHKIGNQKIYRDNSAIEEGIVAEQKREPQPEPPLNYRFEPGTIEVRTSLYVEFEIE